MTKLLMPSRRERERRNQLNRAFYRRNADRVKRKTKEYYERNAGKRLAAMLCSHVSDEELDRRALAWLEGQVYTARVARL